MTFPSKLLAVCGLIFSIVEPAAGASFDCAKASSRIDNAICASSELSELDSKLDLAYRSALAVSTDPPGVRQAQRDWLRTTRNQCGDEACLLTVYMQRVAALSRTSSAQTQSPHAASSEPGLSAPTTSEPQATGQRAAETSAPPVPAAPHLETPTRAAQVATPEPAPSSAAPANAATATAKGQAVGRSADTPQAPANDSGAKADGASMFTMLALVALIVWIAIAMLAKKRGWSMVVGIGGGFIAACVALGIGGAILMPARSKTDAPTTPYAVGGERTDAPRQAQAPVADKSTASQSPTRPSLKSLFDTSIPQPKREEMARDFIAGQYHFADRSLADMASLTNYTFAADGTYTSSHCTAYGEISERKFEPSSGRWSIKEGRYANTGMIYYGLWLDDIPRPSLLLDREDGLQFNFSSSRVKMLPRNTARCE